MADSLAILSPVVTCHTENIPSKLEDLRFVIRLSVEGATWLLLAGYLKYSTCHFLLTKSKWHVLNIKDRCEILRNVKTTHVPPDYILTKGLRVRE